MVNLFLGSECIIRPRIRYGLNDLTWTLFPIILAIRVGEPSAVRLSWLNTRNPLEYLNQLGVKVLRV